MSHSHLSKRGFLPFLPLYLWPLGTNESGHLCTFLESNKLSRISGRNSYPEFSSSKYLLNRLRNGCITTGNGSKFSHYTIHHLTHAGSSPRCFLDIVLEISVQGRVPCRNDRRQSIQLPWLAAILFSAALVDDDLYCRLHGLRSIVPHSSSPVEPEAFCIAFYDATSSQDCCIVNRCEDMHSGYCNCFNNSGGDSVYSMLRCC